MTTIKWLGSAGVCINDRCEVLMVKQGQPYEKKLWTVPSGQLEGAETFEQCCVREFKEETGFNGVVLHPLHVKKDKVSQMEIEVHYFMVRIISGKACIQDPDQLIYEIAWKNADDIAKLEFSFPEDRAFILDLLNECRSTIV
ncbi:NUDIX hydrolase [Caldibacillus lycopersici]|uniref:NUDIX hydrolase n=1 Tax=Perspicuibacillus lycopersici TaxID=1325689 RepID=A0AAE3LP81_9BACI|nr:NUDIX hydrolase [Perspicuibacillus lycopersici]MCU9614667.1 NUDIX hydrolase [Perspicuibacillus lycopersici]